MKKLLRVDSSVRGEDSVSSNLTDIYCERWKSANPDGVITSRHVGISPPPHPTHKYTIANYTPPDKRTADMKIALKESDSLIEELKDNDEYVFAVPMYNFNVPSTFKAYIDNLVRVGMTFNVGPDGFEGLLQDKRLIVISSRGGAYSPPSPYEEFDLLTPYIRTVMGFMGVVNVEFVVAENLDFSGPEQKAIEIKKAEEAVAQLNL